MNPESERSFTATAVDYDPFAGEAIERTAPSTDSQREIWTAAQRGHDASCAFNESNSLRLRGALDEEAFAGAIVDLGVRYEALRTTFSRDGLGLTVAANPSHDVERIDLTREDPEAQAESLRHLIAAEVETEFDLERGPLFRFRLVRLSERDHVFVFTAHHIVCDGWSTGVLIRELATEYNRRRAGRPAAARPRESFCAYAECLRARDSGADEAFWISAFKDIPSVVEFPTDRPRPHLKTYASARIDHTLRAALIERLEILGKKSGASLFTVLLAAFDVLVARLSRSTDVVVAVPTAGQSSAGKPELVGHCVNTLPIRCPIDLERSFSDMLAIVRTKVFDAFDHREYTIGTLLEKLPLPRDPSRLPLTSILFNIDKGLSRADLAFDGLDATFSTNPRHFENFELFVNAVELEDRVTLECQYNTDLFDADTIRRWCVCYETLLGSIVESPRTKCGNLPLLDENALATMARGNATKAAFPRQVLLHEFVLDAASEAEDRVAVVAGSASLTYGELRRRAHRIAHALRDKGVARGTLVGVCVDRSVDMVASVLGVLAAGGAYIPLDPDFPHDRLAFMVADSKMPTILTLASLRSRLPATDAILVDCDGTDVAHAPTTAPDRAPGAVSSDTAYVIYTSGSTGKPKGVCVSHRAVVNFLSSMAKEPGLGRDDVLLAVTTLSFDIAGLEIYLPLVAGARVVVASREQSSDGRELLRIATEHRATAMQATPSTWELLLEHGWPTTLDKVLCGGEAVPIDLARRLVSKARACWNMYGPTETTIWSTCHRLEPGLSKVLIGRPIANTEIYVLDDRLERAPIGVVGELYIGGEGVASGYLGREDLTRERFIANPFRADARLYRTGDLVRLLADGNLEFVGRNDGQVKVRGFRIELGEIESVLVSHPDVHRAVVIVRKDSPGDVRLVAYAIAHADSHPSLESLRRHLQTTLPAYMIPQQFVWLREFPATPNGKIDRSRLPRPEATEDDRGKVYVAPRNDTERLLADLWQSILGVGRMSVHDDFFELGGHSLLAAQMLSRLERDRGLALPFRAIFEAPTIAQMAARIETSPIDDRHLGRIERSAPVRHAPLSLMQQRLWFVEQMTPGTTIYNLPSAFRLRGAMDVDAWRRAIHEIIQRHDSLRTSLRFVDGEPVQVIEDALDMDLEVMDLESTPTFERESRMLATLQEATDRPFDLGTPPLVRTFLVRMTADDHVWFFMPHHAVWDGWSFDILLREMATLYAAYSEGKPSPLPDLPIRYADFAVWQRRWLESSDRARKLAHWRQTLAGPLVPLDLPTDRPRPADMSFSGDTEWVRISKERADRLRSIAHAAGGTLYMAVVAAFYALLHRHTGQEDICLGTPVRGRNRPETEDVIGFFVNAIVLRTAVHPTDSFRDLLGRVREVCLDAFANQDTPFEELVRELDIPRDLSRTPIFQAFLSFQDATSRRWEFGPLHASQVHILARSAATDLSLWLMETSEGLVGGLNYSSDLFDRATIRRILGRFETLVDAFTAAPDDPIGMVNMLPTEEIDTIARWSSSVAPRPRDTRMHAMFEACAASTPDAPAVRYEGMTMSYRELESRANRLARRLAKMGVEKGCLVGLCLERSTEMVVALLAILKTGAAYVPLDPGFPRARLAFLSRDADLFALVTSEALRSTLEHVPDRVFCIDRDAEALADEPDDKPNPEFASRDPAYVLYTSGSTGQPKGVVVPHGAVANFIFAIQQRPGMQANDVLLAVTTLSFDIAVLELMVPLSTGATVVIASRATTEDGRKLVDALERERISVMQATPATWRMLIASGWKGTPGFRAICGGEALPQDLALELVARAREVWNMYGPTETTVWSTSSRVDDPKRIRIGTPIANTDVRVVDSNRGLAPIGCIGELEIGGDGVALGYLGRPELTAERFVDDPTREGARVYRTGDLVRWTSEGELDFLGRNDHQVKVRGFRIELGEIESALAKYEGVRQAAAAVFESSPGDARLVAYLRIDPAIGYTQTALRRFLRTSLPEYMVPQHFVELEAFPITPNGKLDRRALPRPDASRPTAEVALVPPSTPAEKFLAELWRTSLGIDEVGLSDNFFNLGGHSLLCLRIIARVHERTGTWITPRAMVLESLGQIAANLVVPDTVPRAQPISFRAEDRSIGSRLIGRIKRGARQLLRDD